MDRELGAQVAVEIGALAALRRHGADAEAVGFDRLPQVAHGAQAGHVLGLLDRAAIGVERFVLDRERGGLGVHQGVVDHVGTQVMVHVGRVVQRIGHALTIASWASAWAK
jgi:hypothetical protein